MDFLDTSYIRVPCVLKNTINPVLAQKSYNSIYLRERKFVYVSTGTHVGIGILRSIVVAPTKPNDNSCNLSRR